MRLISILKELDNILNNISGDSELENSMEKLKNLEDNKNKKIEIKQTNLFMYD